MISDSTLYSLSIFLGSLAMLLIVLYHFLEVNAQPDTEPASTTTGGATDPKSEIAGLADEKTGVGAVRHASAGGRGVGRSGG